MNVHDAEAAATPADPAPPALTTPVQRRWHVIRLQLSAGHAPCFGTEHRYFCAERERCGYRVECLSLRAVWR